VGLAEHHNHFKVLLVGLMAEMVKTEVTQVEMVDMLEAQPIRVMIPHQLQSLKHLARLDMVAVEKHNRQETTTVGIWDQFRMP
jgi:hypothetical protein